MSVYWEDNIYSGFNKADRTRMVLNYLDGKHLKTIAMNAPDGKIYLYHLDEPLWNKYKEENKDLKGMQFYDTYAKKVMKSEIIYTKKTMPKMNYTVTSNEVRLDGLTKKFFYSDETQVIENKTSKRIGYNRRYMRFFYNIFPNIVGNWYYHQSPMCGKPYAIDEDVLIGKWKLNGFGRHEIDLKKYLYMNRGK